MLLMTHIVWWYITWTIIILLLLAVTIPSTVSRGYIEDIFWDVYVEVKSYQQNRNSPVLVLFDDIDCICSGHSSVLDLSVLSSFILLLDRFIMLGVRNVCSCSCEIKELCERLHRSCRFDVVIHVKLPDLEARKLTVLDSIASSQCCLVDDRSLSPTNPMHIHSDRPAANYDYFDLCDVNNYQNTVTSSSRETCETILFELALYIAHRTQVRQVLLLCHVLQFVQVYRRLICTHYLFSVYFLGYVYRGTSVNYP